MTRVGIVGGGRSRNGTGPFMARFLEANGLPVVAVAGRDADRARRVAEDYAAKFGHDVASYDSLLQMLRDEPIDLLAIATPTPAHAAALDAALDAGCHVLCEKPILEDGAFDTLGPLLDRFAAAGLAIVESCQWPMVLPVFEALWPGLLRSAPRAVAMGMAPVYTDPREMLADSLPHLLSVLQGLLPIDAACSVAGLELSEASSAGCVVRFRLLGPVFDPVEVEFELRPVPDPPRPAWLAVDGRRVDRQIRMPDYAIAFHDASDPARSASPGDPLERLMARVAGLIGALEPAQIRQEREAILHRATLYRTILGEAFGGGA